MQAGKPVDDVCYDCGRTAKSCFTTVGSLTQVKHSYTHKATFPATFNQARNVQVGSQTIQPAEVLGTSMYGNRLSIWKCFVDEEQLLLHTGMTMPAIIQYVSVPGMARAAVTGPQTQLPLSQADIVKFVSLQGDPYKVLQGLAFASFARKSFPQTLVWHWLETFMMDANSHKSWVLAREDNLWEGQAKNTFQWINAGSNQSRAPAQCNPARAFSLTWDHMEAAKVEYATATKVAGSEAQDTVSAAVEVNDFALQLPGTAIQAESLADKEKADRKGEMSGVNALKTHIILPDPGDLTKEIPQYNKTMVRKIN